MKRSYYSLQEGIVRLDAYITDQRLHDVACRSKLFLTNEFIPGILSRASCISSMQPVKHFIGVGRPEKVITQAALLNARNITIIDASPEKIFDGWIVSRAILSRYNISESVHHLPRQTIEEVQKQLSVQIQGDQSILQIERRLPTLEYAYKRMLISLGITASTVYEVLKKVESISLIKGDLKGVEEQTRIFDVHTQYNGVTVVDSSNIPLTPEHRHALGTVDPKMFFAANVSNECASALEYPDALEFTLRGNIIWGNLPPERFGDLPVGYAPDVKTYDTIVDIIDTRANVW